MTSEWTINTLKEHYDTLLNERKEAQQRAIDAAFLAAKELNAQALEAANDRFAAFVAATDKRFESVNEFRGTLSDQAATLLPRTEYEQSQRNYSGDRFSGRTDIRGTVTMIVALVVLAITAYGNLAP
jgi:hypothetical protein